MTLRKGIITALVTIAFMIALLFSTTYERTAAEVPADDEPITGRIDNDAAGRFIKVDWVRLPSAKSERRGDDTSGSPGVETSGAGGGSGQVTIVEYEDYQCPVCAAAAPTLESVAQKYGDQVVIEHKDFPLGYHVHAMDAAMAVRCADAQGGGDQYRSAVYDHQADLSRDALDELAKSAGLNLRQFDSCLDTERFVRDIKSDFADGRRAGVDGTPTFLINGKRYAGALSFEQFQTVIDADLASASGR